MKIEKKSLCEFGVRVKHSLVEINKTQLWLISETKKLLPNRYLDSSYLHKLMVGEVHSDEVCSAMLEVLDSAILISNQTMDKKSAQNL